MAIENIYHSSFLKRYIIQKYIQNSYYIKIYYIHVYNFTYLLFLYYRISVKITVKKKRCTLEVNFAYITKIEGSLLYRISNILIKTLKFITNGKTFLRRPLNGQFARSVLFKLTHYVSYDTNSLTRHRADSQCYRRDDKMYV